MSFKVCNKCGIRKPATTDFLYKRVKSSNAFRAFCKVCAIVDYAKPENKAAKKEYNAKPKSKAIKKEYNQAYLLSLQGKAVRKVSALKNHGKIISRTTLNNAIRTGKIVKPVFCSLCRQEKPLEGHHYDYNKPLDVTWLCIQCHKELHTN